MAKQGQFLPDPFLDAVAIHGEAQERSNDAKPQKLIGWQLPKVARVGGVVRHAKIEGNSGVGEPNVRLPRLAKVSILSRARNNREAGG